MKRTNFSYLCLPWTLMNEYDYVLVQVIFDGFLLSFPSYLNLLILLYICTRMNRAKNWRGKKKIEKIYILLYWAMSMSTFQSKTKKEYRVMEKNEKIFFQPKMLYYILTAFVIILRRISKIVNFDLIWYLFFPLGYNRQQYYCILYYTMCIT